MAFLILNNKKTLGAAAIIVLLAFSVGIIIGHFSKSSKIIFTPKTSEPLENQYEEEQDMIRNIVQNKIDKKKLRSFSRFLSRKPHIAGQERDRELATWIKDKWEDYGMDKVLLSEYEVYMSWPNHSNPNKIYLKDNQGQVKFISQNKEKSLRPEKDDSNFVHAFNAYSPAADVEGVPIYVNYATIEDLQELDKMGMSVEGKICIARYGMIFRGNKVLNCQEKGAVGVILFTDPANVAFNGTEPENVYPNTMFLPGSGIQRGTLNLGGDPLTPLWSSLENVYRENPKEVKSLPKIPCQPIGYDDAKQILVKMGGPDSPENWHGDIRGVQYRIGGEWKSEFSGCTLRLNTNNYFGMVKTPNVIGFIKGSEEPDRYVLMSNHRDAWGFGAVDPSSGTAQMMEVTRVFGEMLKIGWRPRRTLVFCSFTAEEYGLLGSYEWVFHKVYKLTHRAVGLVNTDTCASGPILKLSASPILKDLAVNAIKNTTNPFQDNSFSYYDYWKKWYNQDNEIGEKDKEPHIRLLSSGTDHAAFIFYTGVPSIEIRFIGDNKKYNGISKYANYHTGYDTFHLIDKHIDPGFKIHRTCAQASFQMLMQLADSNVLPYDLEKFPAKMTEALADFEKKGLTKRLADNNATLDHLISAVNKLSQATKDYMSNLDSLSIKDKMELRSINDQLMQFERLFLLPEGIPGRPGVRHAIFAPAKFNNYGAAAFPGISDLLHGIDELNDEDSSMRWKKIRRHLSDLMIMVEAAVEFLQPTFQI